MRLSEKKVLVTAAAQGIGRAICEDFIREGARVIALDINAKKLETLGGADLRTIDVTNKSEFVKVIQEQTLDVLVNCAGVVHSGTILDASDEDFDFSINLNVRSMFHGIQAALPKV